MYELEIYCYQCIIFVLSNLKLTYLNKIAITFQYICNIITSLHTTIRFRFEIAKLT